MNPPDQSAQGRLNRLSRLLLQDPSNPLLLADAAEAAIAAGDFDQAQRFVSEGAGIEGATPAWRFREASLRIAQKRLDDADGILASLRAELPPSAAIDHNLAYIAFQKGDYARCVTMLQPWMAGESDAVHALWLRAMHHLERLKEAWAWVEARGFAHLGPTTAGVASMLAVDLTRMDAAQLLSAAALRAVPGLPEAQLAAGCVALARKDLARAKEVLNEVTQKHPHQARAWSTLGFVELLQMDLTAAREKFERALAIASDDSGTLVGLGWTCVLQGDLDAAARAFQRAIDVDAGSADGHGGLASVLALQDDRPRASLHAERARRLQPGNVAARYAESVLSGNSEGLNGVQRMARRLILGE